MFWALVVFGAFMIGVAKTSIGGLATLAVLTFALAMPTKESTGAVLLLYLAGDLVATVRYVRSCDWRLLWGLVPWVVPGLALGAWFLGAVDGGALKRWIGVILALSVLAHVVLSRRRPSEDDTSAAAQVAGTGLAGIAAGFTTMAANAGGPVMTIYLLAKGVDKHVFVGTAAWYFFIINLTKVPFSVAVGAVTPDVLRLAAVLVPVVWVGCFVGVRVLKVIPQRLFNGLALASSALGAVVLILA